MNRAFRPEPEASAELEDAVVWYDGQRAGLGLEFVQAVDVALERIARWPEIGRRVPGVPKMCPPVGSRSLASRTTSHTWNGME